MVPDEDEGVGKPKRAEADGEGDLRGLVDDAVVKLATRKDRAATAMQKKISYVKTCLDEGQAKKALTGRW